MYFSTSLLILRPNERFSLQVAVAYDAQGENVISNFALKIAPTEKIAIVGRTGAGKVFSSSYESFPFLGFHCFIIPSHLTDIADACVVSHDSHHQGQHHH